MSDSEIKLCKLCGVTGPHRVFKCDGRRKVYSCCRSCETAKTKDRTNKNPFKSELTTWRKMRSRCLNKNDKAFYRYGKRGIKVCERWAHFENFLEDMKPKPTPLHSIDRIDNDGDYEPNNCRWATDQEQKQNKSDNRLLTYMGQTLTMSEWARRSKMNIQTLHARLVNGWTTDRALSTPIQRRRPNNSI